MLRYLQWEYLIPAQRSQLSPALHGRSKSHYSFSVARARRCVLFFSGCSHCRTAHPRIRRDHPSETHHHNKPPTHTHKFKITYKILKKNLKKKMTELIMTREIQTLLLTLVRSLEALLRTLGGGELFLLMAPLLTLRWS